VGRAGTAATATIERARLTYDGEDAESPMTLRV
jgi:hypothetical protein